MDHYRDVLAACRQGIVPERFRVPSPLDCRVEHSETAEVIEQCLVAGCSIDNALVVACDSDEVAIHAYSLWLLRTDRQHALALFGDYWRRDTLARRLMHFEALDDNDDCWQKEARALFLAAHAHGGIESRWTLFAYLECARRLEIDRPGRGRALPLRVFRVTDSFSGSYAAGVFAII